MARRGENIYKRKDGRYNEFIKHYGYVSLNEFSSSFARCIFENYNATKTRKRKAI